MWTQLHKNLTSKTQLSQVSSFWHGSDLYFFPLSLLKKLNKFTQTELKRNTQTESKNFHIYNHNVETGERSHLNSNWEKGNTSFFGVWKSISFSFTLSLKYMPLIVQDFNMIKCLPDDNKIDFAAVRYLSEKLIYICFMHILPSFECNYHFFFFFSDHDV